MQATEFALRIKTSHHFCFGDWVIHAVLHVFFSGPKKFHGCVRKLFCNGNGLPNKIVGATSTPKAASQVEFVDFTLLKGQTRGFRGCGKCCLTVLRWTPNFAPGIAPQRGGIHGLHRCVILERIEVFSLHSLSSIFYRLGSIAAFIANHRLGSGKTFLQTLIDGFAGLLGIGAFVPGDGKGIEGSFGLPPGFCDHGHGGVINLHGAQYPRHFGNRLGIKRLKQATVYRTGFYCSVYQPWKSNVSAINLFAGKLVSGVQPLDRLPCNGPVLWVFEYNIKRGCKLCRRSSYFTVALCFAAWCMRDDAVFTNALRDRHLPIHSCGFQ